jgi:hypothetical protein
LESFTRLNTLLALPKFGDTSPKMKWSLLPLQLAPSIDVFDRKALLVLLAHFVISQHNCRLLKGWVGLLHFYPNSYVGKCYSPSDISNLYGLINIRHILWKHFSFEDIPNLGLINCILVGCHISTHYVVTYINLNQMDHHEWW